MRASCKAAFLCVRAFCFSCNVLVCVFTNKGDFVLSDASQSKYTFGSNTLIFRIFNFRCLRITTMQCLFATAFLSMSLDYLREELQALQLEPSQPQQPHLPFRLKMRLNADAIARAIKHKQNAATRAER